VKHVVETETTLTAGEPHGLLAVGQATGGEYRYEHCLHHLFEKQVQATPARIALREAHDCGDVYHELEFGALDVPASEGLKLCCFKVNPYLHRYSKGLLARVVDLAGDGLEHLNLIGSHRRTHKPVVINDALQSLLAYFDGRSNLQSLHQRLQDDGHEFVVYTLDTAPSRGLHLSCERKSFLLEQRFENLSSLVKVLYRANLVEVAGFCTGVQAGPAIRLATEGKDAEHKEDRLCKDTLVPKSRAPLSPVLLLGATSGSATVGLLYLGSYLRRHGVEAFCQFNDIHNDRASMEQNIQYLLGQIKPKLVGVSLKWSPYIARGLEICRLVKKHAPEVKIVLGGDTATYFAEELIQDGNVDYVIRGDGELPLLRLVMGDQEIPNCTYKRRGVVVRTPTTYVHGEGNSAEIYLSHLDELLVSPTDLFWSPFLFVPTGQGCSMHCFYCAGSSENQRRVFNRERPYLRPIQQVRQDILRTKEYNATLMFDFDLPEYDSLDYYRRLWEGLDLGAHSVGFAFWDIPCADLVALVARTFKHASLLIDVCSLSERHRQHLASLKAVKPQPTDAQILEFFDVCEEHDNVEVSISVISGLPCFAEEDVRSSEEMLSRIMSTYTCFRTLELGALHAQPGAPLTSMYGEFGMAQSASTYEEYLECSKANLERHERGPGSRRLRHPLIRYQDEGLNALAGRHFEETITRLSGHQRKRRRGVRYHYLELSYQTLNQRADRVANHLTRMGVGRGTTVGICAEPSSEMVAAILGIWKAGGAYVPLGPQVPSERLSFMLEDSAMSVLLTQEALVARLPTGQIPVVCLDGDWMDVGEEDGAAPASQIMPENVACLVYTADSSDKPKRVRITHRELCSLVMAQMRGSVLQPEDRVLRQTLRGVDDSLLEGFSTLLRGATLCLVLLGGLFVLWFPTSPSLGSGQGPEDRSSDGLDLSRVADQSPSPVSPQERGRRQSHVG
jgi:hypothetical protein